MPEIKKYKVFKDPIHGLIVFDKKTDKIKNVDFVEFSNGAGSLTFGWIANLELFEKLSESRPQLRELPDDHGQLLEAIAYWEGRSGEKVTEFLQLAMDLEEEIMEFSSEAFAVPDRPGREP